MVGNKGKRSGLRNDAEHLIGIVKSAIAEARKNTYRATSRTGSPTTTLKDICGLFGPLEHFKWYKTEAIDGDNNKNPTLYPSLHNVPRKPNMEVSCLNVKSSFREDCINALMTPLVNDFAPNGDAKDWNPVPQPPSATSMSQTPTWVDPNSKIWLETDFPPLFDPKNLKSESGDIWVEKKLSAKAEKDGMGGSSESRVFGTASSRDSVVHSLKSGLGPCTSITPLDIGQELELSHTPSLARSPVTPKMPGSVFSPTPTRFHGGQPGGLSSKEMDDYPYVREEILVDNSALNPTSLFVGGLEMHGPGSFDEEKVYNYFSQRFSDSGKPAFAFVKFNNTEGPAYAVYKLHNHVVEGHAMRVQLRDCNPSCGAFQGSRGRGCYSNFSHGHHHCQSAQNKSKKDKSVDASCGEPLTIEEATVEAVKTVDAAAGPDDSSPV
ncbi:hypothetical protein BT96DRAFT_948528 [Gymnopus androsaceus JB14]|uniref:RRM domain-containing protein n=1 Tax=Gymnopus androsaceus JB14 TaxID=1447944 RepID=A0A6A4GP34_9AGAR|nr:hypothetical protein BT96DRAFT_948528 [Gymnopus androsaceus JB14]